ncbi:MAG: YqaA family protein [Bdellovibrionota bacterium]
MINTIETQKTQNPLKRLYFWTIHWAGTPYAVPALVLLSFAESSFFPVPPDVLLITLCFSQPKRWFKFALFCTIASVMGGMLGYAIGWGLWDTVGQPIVNFYHGQEVILKIKTWYDSYGFWGVLVAAITPIPYKIFTIASGSMHFNFVEFIGASILGRGLRFFAVAWLIRKFGVQVKPFLEKHFEIASIVFTVLLILGFVAVKYLF